MLNAFLKSKIHFQYLSLTRILSTNKVNQK